MKLKVLKMTLMVGASIFMATQAVADFDITRMTTVVDDFSGSYTVTQSGRLNEAQINGTSITEFNQFHPGPNENEATLTGMISKQVSRGGGQLNTTSDGDFTLETLAGFWDISFTGLAIQADDSGVELTGTVLVNEESYDASDLPESVAAVLRRVFWLTRK